VTRHAAVTANAILTIHELSGGRAVLGIATGDSAVRRIGARPVRLADLEQAISELRPLLAGDAVPSAGGRFGIRFARPPGPPIYLVATGLRAAELAGRVADGVVLNVGTHPAVLRAARERIEAGARVAGRDPAALDVVAFFFCAITGEARTAHERLQASASWFCQRFPGLCAVAGLPLDAALRAALVRFEADYARYDLIHSDQRAQAVRDASFRPRRHRARRRRPAPRHPRPRLRRRRHPAPVAGGLAAHRARVHGRGDPGRSAEAVLTRFAGPPYDACAADLR
jgi:alkanesulfonate monooxygenase SsuD/methylene tetrahydromethanopterin reductase-like flavin-dependent oxidoreductase (luciferase family)